MSNVDYNDLTAFMAVAEERSFTRAAARLSTSQSALSHTIRRLEERLGLRLLTRTTRSVSTTDAGERLLETIRPAFDDIDTRLAALSELRDKPAGAIRLTTAQHAADKILWPALSKFLPQFPDISVELSIDAAFTDIVANRFDGGVRLGEQVARDMIAVRVGPEERMLVVGAPAYFANRTKPKTPHDLTNHVCINLRLPTRGSIYAWEFEKDGRALNVRVDGQFTVNEMGLVRAAALEGLGLAYVPEDQARPLIADGRLIRVLADWSPYYPGYHLFYPSRRQLSPAFALLVEALRYRGKK